MVTQGLFREGEDHLHVPRYFDDFVENVATQNPINPINTPMSPVTDDTPKEALNIVMAAVSTLDGVVSGAAVPEAHTFDLICGKQKIYLKC